MKPELFWLICTATFTALQWIPYVVNRIRELGPPSFSAWFPPADPPHQAAWANRSARAHGNAIEGLVTFAPLAIATALLGGTEVTAVACQTFFIARVSHTAFSTLGAPIPFRTIAFLTAFACQMTLAGSLLIRFGLSTG